MLAFSSIALVSSYSFLGYNSGVKRVGGTLTVTELLAVSSSINLLECIGEEDAAADLQAMLFDNGINREDGTGANRQKGNSADVSRISDAQGGVHNSWAMNIGRQVLLPAIQNKKGARAELASSLMHEYTHLSKTAPDNNESEARIAQAKVICALICSTDCGITDEERKILCVALEYYRNQACMSSNRYPGVTVEDVLAAIGECHCCDNVSWTGTGGYYQNVGEPSSLMAQAAGHASPAYDPGGGVFTPLTGPYLPDFVISTVPSPRLEVAYRRPSDDLLIYDKVPFDLTIYPTAITGDGAGNLFISGLSPAGLVTVVKYEYSFSGDSISFSNTPVTMFTSPKMKSITDMQYSNADGKARIFALDGESGIFGYFDLDLSITKILRSKKTDPQMSDWKSFGFRYDSAADTMSFELSEKFSMPNWYEKGDPIYVLTDINYDSSIETAELYLAEEVCQGH